jgi:hypothetical protein
MAGIPPIAYTATDGNFGSSSGKPTGMQNYSKIGKIFESLNNTFSTSDVHFIGGDGILKDPVLFSYFNGNDFRILLADYTYILKHVGTSKIWLGDPSSGWNWKNTNVSSPWDSPLETGTNPPRNIYAVVNASSASLYFGDWDSGPLPYPNESIINIANICKYNLVAGTDLTGPIETMEYVSKLEFGSNIYEANDEPLPEGYVTHVSDIVKHQNRLFVLVNASDNDAANYLHGRIVEVADTNDVLSIVSYVKVDKNAFSIVPRDNYLFVPCVGGYQHYGSGNGVNSSLCAVNISNSSLAAATRPFKGGNNSTSLDFRSMVIASTGEVFVLCGNYLSSARHFDFALYKDTLTNITNNISAGTVLNPMSGSFATSVGDPVNLKPLDCYYRTLAITSDDFVIFPNTAKTQDSFLSWDTNTLSFDQLHIFPATDDDMDSADIVTYTELRSDYSPPSVDPGLALSSIITIDPISGNLKVWKSQLPQAGGQHFHGSSNFAKAIQKAIKQQKALLKQE